MVEETWSLKPKTMMVIAQNRLPAPYHNEPTASLFTKSESFWFLEMKVLASRRHFE